MPKILNRISFTTIAVLTAFITLAVYSDDIVGIRRYDAGTNEFIGVEMPFDSISAGPSAFISGDFLGDGSIFSDRLYLCSQDGAGAIDKTSDLNEHDEVQLNYAFLSDGIWLDSSTLSRSTMTPTAGDTLYLLRADAEPFSFFLHGRYPFSPYYTFPIPSFSQISVSRGVASIRFDTDRPVDIFQSNNNKINCLNWSYIGRFPYSQEIQFATETSTNATSYFLVSDATLDTDADAISDALEKYVYGTSANLADTDFDGIPDALEIAWNRNPLLADEISQTLFCETFEPPQVTIGSLDGQNSWNATHNVLVQDAISDSGGSSLLICAHSNETGVASHAINASTNKTVWIDCRVSHEDFANAELPSVSPFVLAFVFDAFGHPVMTDGFTIVTNTAFVCDTKEYFHRVTMHLDFNLRRWNLYIDGILAGENLSMRGENPALNEIFFEGDYGFADDIKVTTARPEGLSSDFDKMSDEWEMSSFGSLSRDGKGDFDSDGLLDEEEYIYGTDPKYKDTDLDSIPDSWEVLQSLNPLDSSDAAADFDNDGLTNLQEYHYDSNPFMSENSLFLLKEGFRDGINVSYYRSDSALTTLPDVSKLDFIESKIVTNINENTATNALGNAPSYLTDNFVAIYSGYIYIPTAGMVTFTLASDDGSRLTIDSQTLIDNDGTHTKLSKKATKSFMPGLYPFSLEYFNASSTAELMLSWKLPNGEETQIPAENYYILKYPGSENIDLDRDGMQDWWEKIQGFDSSSAADAILDSDADGLTNVEEFSIRSNPYAVDSDGDTLTDMEEVFLGSSPIKIDTDNDGLPDALELRYGWDPNWPGETDPVNAPNGPFTTFTHYADGTKASVDAKLRNAINKEAIVKFTVKVDISSPDPYDMTVYGLGSPGGIATLDDMITRDSCRNYTTANTNNFIYVKTLNPKPAFCPDQTGILMIKLKCDDHAKVTIGNITVENAWPNEEYALAWGIVEANTVNPVDITWDSNKGGCWNLDYECYFYPEKPRPPSPEDDDCECGCGYAFNAANGSVSIRQVFGSTPNVPSLPRGSLRIREVEPSSCLASPECLYYDHPMERRVKISNGTSSTISVPNGEEIVYKNGRPHGYSAGLDSSLSVDDAGRLVERLPDGLLVVYDANGLPVALKPEQCREIAVAELGISIARDSQGVISSITSASDGTMSVARTSASSFNITWTDATNGYVKTFMFSQPSSNIFELNEFVNPSMNTTYRWEYSEEERGWTFVNDYGKADARTESRTAVWNDEERTWTKTQVWYNSDGTPGETETKVYTANGHYPKLSRIERGGEIIYQAAPGATGRAGITTNETGLATENIHDRYGRRVKSSQIVKGGLVETEIISYKPVSSGGFVDFRPVRMIRTLDGIEIERTAWLYETNRTTTARTVNGVTRTSFMKYDGLGREVLSVSEDGRATRRTYSTDLPVGACTETSEAGVFLNGAFSLVDGKSERTVSERNALGDEIRTERFALVGGQWHSLSFETKTYNAKHQVVSTQHSNGKSSSAAWICTGPLWQLGTDGIATTNVYDGTKSLVLSTRYSPLGAVTTEYVRDCRDRVVQEMESAPGVEMRTTTRTYDERGRLASMTDEQGRTTTYAYSVDNRTTTETLPSGATRITTVNPGGSTASVTGTAQAAEFYSYGVTEDALEWTQVNYLSPDGARWRRTYKNGFGETVREEWPGFGNLTQRHRDMAYDAKGRMVRVEETGKPVETRKYDSFGEVTNVTYSVDDEWRRIATDTANALIDDEIWRVSSRTFFCSDPSIAPLVTTNMTQVSGLSLTNESRNVSIDIRGNASESWSEFDPVMAKRISYACIPTATNIALEESIDGATVHSVSHSAVTNTVAFDAYRREVVRTDGRGNATTNAYDTLGRLASVTDPLGATTRYAYDAIGNLVAVTNALGNATIYEYDLRGNKTYEGGATYPVRYTYDVFGNKTTMTTYRREGRGNGEEGSVGDTTSWLYDEASGSMTNKVYANGKGPKYDYTPDGKLAQRTWARGITTDYYYDGWGNLTNTVYSDGTPTITLFYDTLGRQTEAHDAAGVTTFLYDAFGSLTNETVIGVAGTNTIIRHWDNYGRSLGYSLVGRTVPSAPQRQSTLAYDPATGRLATMLANGSNTPFTWSYLPSSDMKSSLAYPNGLTASWTYDSNNQLLQVCNAVPTNTISQYDYTYDSVGRRIEIARSGSAMSENRNDSYGYNIRNELISAAKSVGCDGSGAPQSPTSTTEYAYQYDDIGNRITSFDHGTNRTYTANNLNQYLEISTSDAGLHTSEFVPQFDDDGNQTLIKTATGIWQIQYNGENRPILWQCVSTNSLTPNSTTPPLITMSYDRMGRRVTKNNKRFVYDGYLQIANSELQTLNSKLQTFVWDPTEPVATRPLVWNCEVSSAFYTHDGNKNVSEVVSVEGDVSVHYEYAPFGAARIMHGESVSLNPWRFSSEFAEDEVEMVYYNYRHYEPNISRWESRDPYGERAGLSLYCFLANRGGGGARDVLGLAVVPVNDFFKNHANKKTYRLKPYVSVNAYEIMYKNSWGDLFSFPWQKVELKEYFWRVEFTARFSPPPQLSVDKFFNSWGSNALGGSGDMYEPDSYEGDLPPEAWGEPTVSAPQRSIAGIIIRQDYGFENKKFRFGYFAYKSDCDGCEFRQIASNLDMYSIWYKYAARKHPTEDLVVSGHRTPCQTVVVAYGDAGHPPSYVVFRGKWKSDR